MDGVPPAAAGAASLLDTARRHRRRLPGARHQLPPGPRRWRPASTSTTPSCGGGGPTPESTSTWQCGPVPDDDLRAITTDLADGPSLEIEEEACGEATLQLQLVGVNAWGDVGTTWSDCGYWSVDGSGTYRVLGSGAQSAIDRIVAAGGAPPLPEATPRTPPDEVVLLFTDLLNDGRTDEALALTNDPGIADVDGRLDVKVEGVEGLPVKGPLGTPREVAVTTLYRVVPPDRSSSTTSRPSGVSAARRARSGRSTPSPSGTMGRWRRW